MRSYNARLTIFYREEVFSRSYPRGFPIWVVTRTEFIPTALEVMIVIPPPLLASE
jgi:hypothetical protein